jgi:stress response protein YsnF
MTHVTAFYDTRAEAETAKARLTTEANSENVRILTSDTVAELETMKIDGDDARAYREELKTGAVLLIAEIPSGEDPDRIVRLLKESAQGALAEPAKQSVSARSRSDGPSYGGSRSPGEPVLDEARLPIVQEELRIGKREVARGGAKVRSFAKEELVEEDVTLREEHLEPQTRPADRRLTVEEVQSAGLLKDRVIEVSEMREEPVVTKEAFVREEVILKKAVSERTETIRETVRHTEIDVEELPGSPPSTDRINTRERDQQTRRSAP